MSEVLVVDERQVRHFRARRAHLVGPGAVDLASCASDILGAQAQVASCAVHALSVRTAGRPTATQVQAAIAEQRRADLGAAGDLASL